MRSLVEWLLQSNNHKFKSPRQKLIENIAEIQHISINHSHTLTCPNLFRGQLWHLFLPDINVTAWRHRHPARRFEKRGYVGQWDPLRRRRQSELMHQIQPGLVQSEFWNTIPDFYLRDKLVQLELCIEQEWHLFLWYNGSNQGRLKIKKCVGPITQIIE